LRTCKRLGNFRKIRLAIEKQDQIDRQNICAEKLFDKTLEQTFIIKALRLSLMEYKDSKVQYLDRQWDRDDLIAFRQKFLEKIGFQSEDIPVVKTSVLCSYHL
jgi:uncharacterized UBP type Zn finger protein